MTDQQQPGMLKKTMGAGKKGFDKAWGALDKLGAPVNRLSNKLGSEAFWPMTLDKESEKIARILRSFCKDGVYVDEDTTTSAPPPQSPAGKNDSKAKIDKPKGKPKVLKKIPSEVIRQAKGLVIFTAMRTGLWFSGAGGSGLVIGRDPQTGEWSAPSGILLHTAGLGFLVGADIYDCVMVINTYEALEAFTKVRVTLGSEVTVAAGPVGMGGVLESEVHKRRAPIWSYVKSRGFYAGVQIDGTIVIERNDENERFYGRKLPAKEILSGAVKTQDPSVKMLNHTIRSAQGDAPFDQAPSGVPVPTGPSPSDYTAEDLNNTNMSGAAAYPAGPPAGYEQAGNGQYQHPGYQGQPTGYPSEHPGQYPQQPTGYQNGQYPNQPPAGYPQQTTEYSTQKPGYENPGQYPQQPGYQSGQSTGSTGYPTEHQAGAPIGAPIGATGPAPAGPSNEQYAHQSPPAEGYYAPPLPPRH